MTKAKSRIRFELYCKYNLIFTVPVSNSPQFFSDYIYLFQSEAEAWFGTQEQFEIKFMYNFYDYVHAKKKKML
jgi:hypothetical protein